MSESTDCAFCDILNGDAPGTIIVRDDEKRMALIQSLRPESAVHWLAVPFEHVDGTRKFEAANSDRFLELVEFAIDHTQAMAEHEAQLQRGFTIKMHFGSFETVEHPKLHVLAME